MRVLVVSSVFPNRRQPSSGVFVRARVRQVARSCEVEVVAPVPCFPYNRLIRGKARSDVPRRETDGGLSVSHPRFFSLPAFGKSLDGLFYFLGVVAFVRRLRQRFRFDVIDAHFGYPDGMAAVLLGKVFGCPVVLTLRGNELDLEPRRLRRAQLRFALRHARVIAVSDNLRQLAERLGVDSRRVRVIPNGVDTAVFRPGDKGAARRALGLPEARPILLSVAAFVARKGQEVVIDQLPRLRRQIPDLLYAAVGNPGGGESRLPAIERRVREEGGADRVRLAVSRPHEEIATWMVAADVFCLLSAREGCPNAVIEALACGVPVVTTAVGGSVELVRDGVNGYLVRSSDPVAFGDALLRALRRSWDAAEISATATRSWQDVGHEVLEELRGAVAEPRCAAARGAAATTVTCRGHRAAAGAGAITKRVNEIPSSDAG